MNKNILKYLPIAALAVGCASLENDNVNFEKGLHNAIYIEGAYDRPVTKIIIDNDGGQASFTPRAANPLEGKVTVNLTVDESVLKSYNEKNGTTYTILPSEYFSLSSDKVEIDPGMISNGSVTVKVNPLDDKLSPSTKYAIPVKIAGGSAEGVLQTSNSMIFALDRILRTTATYFSLNALLVEFPEPMQMDTWTISYGFWANSTNVNNQSVVSFTGVYSRLTAGGTIQFKAGETDDPNLFTKTSFKASTWYHLAWVYDNQNVKCYVNGVLDNEFQTPVRNSIGYIRTHWCQGFRGYMREVRIYDKALTQRQINDALYIEDPKNPSLVFYAPLTKESQLKDVIDNGKTPHNFYFDSASQTNNFSDLPTIDVTFP